MVSQAKYRRKKSNAGQRSLKGIGAPVFSRSSLALLALAFAMLSFLLLKPGLTGFTILTTTVAQQEQLNLAITENTTHFWLTAGDLRSIKVSGSLIGGGYAKVWIENNGRKYLVYDTAAKTSITGAAVSDAAELNDDDLKDSDNEVRKIKDDAPKDAAININLNYNEDTLFDIDNDGIETLSGVVDFTVKETGFNWLADQTKLCTSWKVLSTDTFDSTTVCQGNSDCCAQFKLLPTLDAWNESFNLYYNRYGATPANLVYAQVFYYNKDASKFIFSQQSNLPAAFKETANEFVDKCSETCSVTGFTQNGYNLTFEVYNATLKIARITYDVLREDSKQAPQQLKDIPDLALSQGSIYELELSQYFIDADTPTLSYTYYNANVSMNFSGNTARIATDNIGEFFTFITASDGSSTVTSNLFKLAVNAAPERELELLRAKVGEVGRWKKRVNGTPIEIPGFAYNLTVVKVEDGNAIELERAKIKVLEQEQEKDLDWYEDGKREKRERKDKSRGEESFGTQDTEELVTPENQTVQVILREPMSATAEYYLYYDSPAPASVEQNVDSFRKQVTISSDVPYTDVTAFATLPQEISQDKVKVYWLVNGERQIVSSVNYYDTNNNSLIDYIEWTVPHLSNQTFEIEITVLNVQSYPTVGGNWTVSFNTTGTGNLTIYAYNLTTYTEFFNDDNETTQDLQPLEIKCGDTLVWSRDYKYANESARFIYSNGTKALLNETLESSAPFFGIFIESYNCDGQIGTHTVKVLTPGIHDQRFNFSNQIAEARNLASVAANKSVTDAFVDKNIADFNKGTFNVTNATDINLTLDEWDFDPDGNLSLNLSAYFKLDEASGSRRDPVNNHTLNDINSTSVSTSNPGIRGIAAQFDSTNDQVLYTSGNASLAISNGTSFTVAAWFYVDSKVGDETIAGHLTHGGSRNSSWDLVYKTSAEDAVQFIVYDSECDATNDQVQTAGPLSTGRWYFVVAWLDNDADTMYIQLDNGSINSTTTKNGTCQGTGWFAIGARINNGGAFPNPADAFNGRIDEVGIWKRVLSARERSILFNRTTNLPGNTFRPNAGNFTSQYFEANTTVSFTSMYWTQKERYGMEFQGDEINSSLVLLMHFNNDTGESERELNATYNLSLNSSTHQPNLVLYMPFSSSNAREIAPNASTILVLNFNNDSALGENRTFFIDNATYKNNATCDLASGKCPVINKSDYMFGGAALQFNGTGGSQIYINISNPGLDAPLANRNNFTLETWFKIRGLTSTSHGIAEKGGGSALSWDVIITSQTSGQFYAQFCFTDNGNENNGLNRGCFSNGDGPFITDSNWHHLAVVFNVNKSTGAEKAKMYIDGSLMPVNVVNAGNTLTSVYESTGDLKIGYAEAFGGESLNGSLDQFVLWNDTLGPDIIAKHAGYGIDLSMYGNNASFMNGSNVSQSGKFGEAMFFDGINDCVRIPDADSLEVSGQNKTTMEAWVRLDESLSSINMKIVNKNSAYFIQKIGTDKLRWRIDNSAGAALFALDAVTALSKGRWYHVAATYNGSIASMYIDGILDNATAVASSDSYVGNTNPLYIGAETCDFDAQVWNGSIDEVAIWNISLPADTIAEHAGVKVRDWSQYGNNGTRFGNVTFNGTQLFGKSMGFDGVNDFVNVTNSSSIGPGTRNFTTEYWFKTSYTSDVQYMVYHISDTNHRFYQRMQANGAIYFFMKENANQVEPGATSASGYNDGNWHHIANVYERSGNAKVYVDGVNILTTSITSIGDLGNLEVDIGKDGGGGPNYFNGNIDEIAIWNQTLPESEIRKHYERGVLKLNLSYRTSSDNITWNAWTYVGNSTKSSITVNNSARFFQYRLEMNTSDATFTPVFNNITINFTSRSNLSILDTSERLPRIAIVNRDINFTANFSVGNNPIQGTAINCSFSENSSGTWSAVINMSYSSDDKVYYYNKSFNTPGLHSFNVTCDGTAQSYGIQSTIDVFNVSVAAFGIFNGNTTNFNLMPNNATNISDAVLENLTYGRIRWKDNISAYGADFDAYIVIANNYVSINSSALDRSINGSVNITLYNVNVTSPRIFKDGAECTVCTLLSYNGFNITFNATGFSNFSAENGTVNISVTLNASAVAPSTIVFVYGKVNLSNGTNLTNQRIFISVNGTNKEVIKNLSDKNTTDFNNGNYTNTTSRFFGGNITLENSTLNTGLIAYWKLDEASGNRADSVGSNTLVDQNTVTSVEGKQSNAAHFNASLREHLNITDNAAISTGDIDFTIAAWAYIGGYSGGSGYIFARRKSGETGEYTLEQHDGAGTYAFKIYQSPDGGQVGSTVSSIKADIGHWYLVIGWHDSVNNQVGISVWNDTGIEVINTGATTGAPGDSTLPLSIGGPANAPDFISNFFNGSIDEAAFWKRLLSPAERRDLYNRGHGITHPFNYTMAGNFTSQVFDAGNNVTWSTLYWTNTSTPLGTNISFQVRSSADNITWSAFTGPDGSANTYHIYDNLSSLNVSDGRYFQYRAYFISNWTNTTPQLINVSINYSAIYTDSDGNYNVTFTAPSNIGTHPVVVNTTYNTTFGPLVGSGTQNLVVEANVAPNEPILNYPPTDIFIITPYTQLNFTPSDNNTLSGVTQTCFVYADNLSSTAQGLVNISTLLNNGTIYSFNYTNLNQTTYFWTVHCSDGTLNGTNATIRNFTVDTLKPSIDYTTPTDANATYINRNWLFVNVTVSDLYFNNISFFLFNASGVLLNMTNYTGSQNFTNFTSLEDGNYLYNVTARDSAGNENSTATRNITLDTRFPSIDLVYPSPANNSRQLNNSVIINVSGNNTSPIKNCYLELDNGSLQNITMEISASSNYCNYTLTTVSGNTYIYRVYVNDSAGNLNVSVYNQFRENIPPNDTRLIAPANDTRQIGNSVQLNYSATDFDNDTITYFIFINGNDTDAYTLFQKTGSASFTYPSNDNTTYYWKVLAYDGYENNTLNSSVFRFRENAAPTIPEVIRPNTTLTFKGGASELINFTNSTDMDNDTVNISIYYSTDSGVTFPNVITSATINNGSFIWSVPSINTVTAKIRIIANDSYELTQDDSDLNFRIDSNAPTISLDSPPNASTVNSIIFINFTISDNIAGIGTVIWGNGSYNSTDFFGSYDINVSNFTAGVKNITIYANDSAGNFVERIYTFTLTAVQDIFEWVSPNANQNVMGSIIINVTNTTQFPTTGGFANFSYEAAAQNFTLSQDGNFFTYTFDTTSVADGLLKLMVFGNNTAGTIVSTERYVTVDNTRPKLALNSPGNDTWKNGSVTFAYTPSDANNITACSLLMNGSVNATNTSITNNAINTFLISLSDAHYTWNVNCTDQAGNIGNNATDFRVKIDTVLPTITLDDPPNGTHFQANYSINFSINDSVSGVHNASWSNNYTALSYDFLGVYDINTSTWAEGNITVTIVANDSAGNRRESKYEFTVDNTGPVLRFITPNANQKVSGIVVVNLSATDDLSNVSSVTFSYNSTDNFTMNRSNGFRWYDWNTTLTKDGTYTMVASGNDTVTPPNLKSVSRLVQVDNTRPTVKYLSPGNNSFEKNGSIRFTFQPTDANEMRNCSLIINSTINATKNLTNGIINSINISLADNTYTWNINCTDEVGNIGDNASFTITVDTQLPSIEYAGGTAANATAFNRNWLFVNVTIAELNFNNISFFLHNGSSGALLNWTNYTGSQNFTNFTSLGEGIYLYNVTVYDKSNNSNTTPTRNITLDTKTPSIEYAGGTAANATFFSRNWLFVNVSVSDTSFNNITFALYNGSTGAIINETNYTTLTTSINFTPLGEGNYLYNVTARDRAGNINYTATRNITLDTSTPSIDYAGGTEINASSFNRNWIFVNVSITETNFNNVTFALYNGSGGAILNETNYTILTAGSNFTTLGDGNYLYNVTARDKAGNVNYTAARNITLDSRTPSIDYAGGTEINATFFNRNWIFVNVSVTDINFNNITFALYNGSTGAILNETNYTTLTSSINFTPLGDGNYLYNVTARDSAGNENTTATRNITLDTRTPAIDYAGGTATDAATVSQSWIFVNVSIAEANFNNITFALHSGSTGAILNETNYTTLTTSTNFTSLADGSYKYNVTARDAAANQNKTATRSVTIDTSVAAPVAGGSTGGGGESGGGSGIAPPKKKVVVLVSAFEVSRSSLKYTTVERSELSDEIIIRNTGQTNITVSISSSLDSLLSLSASSLDILAGQQATLSLRISALEPGIYNGNIVLAADSVTKTIPVVIEVNSRTAAASMSIDVPSEHSIVTEGEALRAQVTLFALGDQHDLGVAVRYFIRSAEGSLITEEQEEFIFESQLSFVKEFDTRNLAPGGYIIGIEAASKEGIVVASSPFTVSRQLAASAPPHVAALSRYFAVSIIVFGVILLTFLGIIMHRRIRSGNRR